tara:strand:+ start:520932 stop:523850 length:2919 start_codon:yes stop_codon:yes gene_type:complete
MNKLCLSVFFLIIYFTSLNLINGQSTLDKDKIAKQISTYKNDVRGTYKNIRWFCNDGSIKQPQEPCSEAIGGIQHASYKDDVIALSKSNHVFLGQILAYTDKIAFWDAINNHSRLKQYQLGKYLGRIDNGWVNQKGQFYRGAIQVEDEEEWGVQFYKWLLTKDDVLEKEFYLVLQSLKDIPHKGDDDISQLMRAQSKVISDQFSKFMDLRVKIHSNPEANDIEKVVEFKKDQASKLPITLSKKMDALIGTMKKFHQPVNLNSLNGQLNKLTPNAPLTLLIKTYINKNTNNTNPSSLTIETSKVLLEIRKQLLVQKSTIQRLQLLELTNQLETVIFKEAALWNPITIDEQLQKIYALSAAAAGTGMIELWEWNKIESIINTTSTTQLTLAQLTEKLETARSVVEWSTAMVKANYQDIVNIYTAFEPKSYSFIDDRIRASVALQLGKSVGELGTFIAKESALTNKVLNLNNQSTFRGLNPGYAFGELVVVSGSPDDINVSGDKIYIFERAPADLKPVAGIATVAEGNLVSHVQLLARNLGIPNTVLSDENLRDLEKFSGKKVFYAVSNKGNVIIKLEADMAEEERALFAVKIRKEEKITVPIDEIRLDQNSILNLKDVNSEDSGKLCGPKAANLGQLKELFPDKVVEGFVIPFGIFRNHMDQPMPNQNKTYWQFLNAMFKEADAKRNQGISESEVENYQLRELETLRAAIKIMPIKQAFLKELTNSFKTILGKDIGQVPVFLRSDTNMEDLKDFTGAGLNLTIFNVLDQDKIIQGIKDVWASPYTERSFKWRQKYLSNPENVFPSILVIPSVDVDYSGVMITKGISSGNETDLTIAFSRGAGGAVDGQAAESYLIKESGANQLISPAREAYYNTLPSTGGTGKKIATFEKPILNSKNFSDISELAEKIRKTLAKKTKSHYKGAYDIEFGFKNDKLWLFQIRPFVENKKALGSGYLESITPKIDTKKQLLLSTKL